LKVLVTGAAGFIGMHSAARLLARGDEVIGIDNLSPYYSVELKATDPGGHSSMPRPDNPIYRVSSP